MIKITLFFAISTVYSNTTKEIKSIGLFKTKINCLVYVKTYFFIDIYSFRFYFKVTFKYEYNQLSKLKDLKNLRNAIDKINFNIYFFSVCI